MWVLLGINDESLDEAPIVYFMGVFDDLHLAELERKKLMLDTKRSDYIIKSVTLNKSYDYNWSNDDDGDIKNV